MASKFWTKHNDDAKASQHRAAYVAEHGGEWVYRGRSRGWHHSAGESTPRPVIASTPKKKVVKKTK